MTIKLLSMLSTLVFACQAIAASCKDISMSKGQQIYKVPSEMSWMQAFGDCRVSYTSSIGLSSIFNYCSKKSESITPMIDAFPIPGSSGNIYVHPDHVSFFSAEEARRSTQFIRSIFQDKDLKGVYQSVGLLKKDVTEDKNHIRILMGSLGRYRDYEVSKLNGTYSKKAIGPIKKACENVTELKLERELPILSRDGTRLAFRDRTTRNTVIYKIDSNGDCEKLPAEIPFETSKVAFVFGSSSVDFLVYDANTKSHRLLRMDVNNRKISAISLPDEDITYMTTREDGKILYGRKVKKSNDSFDYELVLLDQIVLQNKSNDDDAKAIGYLWAQECNKKIDSEMAVLVGRRIDNVSCKKLAASNGNKSLEVFCGSNSDVKTNEEKPQQLRQSLLFRLLHNQVVLDCLILTTPEDRLHSWRSLCLDYSR